MSSSYTRLPRDDSTRTSRFERPRPPAWQRAALIVTIIFLCWLAFYLRPAASPQPKIIYASRYSEEFKYRPAASPVITEQLKDGRIRLRGAVPTH